MNPPPLSEPLRQKRQRVLTRLRAEVKDVVVAFSGGVDSTLLLALALEALGPERVVAVTAASESLPASELSACRGLAKQLGARHEVFRTQELARPGYVANAGDRCYHCKTELFEVVARKFAGRVVAYGATVDDFGDYRPGLVAAAEAGAIAPLAEAELGKGEIRALSRELGLPNWDKPAHPCLASRVPHGEVVSAAKLAMIEAAEACLRARGFREFRVRHHELPSPTGVTHLARIELLPQDLARFSGASDVSSELAALGYTYVTLDLEGFRSGRLNDVLPAEASAGLPRAGLLRAGLLRAGAPRRLPVTS